MTTFTKANFHFHGGYLTYSVSPTEYPKFVARFKYVKGNRAGFQAFLIKNFTVEEYFARLETEAPMNILESKGYVSAHIAKILKAGGYPVSPEGKAQYINEEHLKRMARINAAA